MLSQRLVRPLLVVFTAEEPKRPLLRPPIGRRRVGRVLLERAMKTLLAAVGAGPGPRNAFHLDAQLEPPHAEPTQTLDSTARKRRPVVAADGAGQPVLAKHRLQHPLYLHEVAGIDGLAAQRVAAGIVNQGQRVDASAIAAQEPALEVDRDDVVGLFGVRQRLAVGRGPAAFRPWPGEPFVMQDLADRRGSGRALERLLALEHGADLGHAPQRMLAADLENAGRVPGIKIHDTRVPRLMEVLLDGGTQITGWRSRQMQEAVLEAYGLTEQTCTLGQLRYDLHKLKAHGLLERLGHGYCYRLTPQGIPVALLFLLFHKRVRGPLARSLFGTAPAKMSQARSKIRTACRQAGTSVPRLVDLLAAA